MQTVRSFALFACCDIVCLFPGRKGVNFDNVEANVSDKLNSTSSDTVRQTYESRSTKPGGIANRDLQGARQLEEY